MRKIGVYEMSGIPGMSQQDMANISARLSRVESVTPYRLGGGSFAPTDFLPINFKGVRDGKIDLGTAAALDFSGIMSPNIIDGAFTVASPSDSTATVYWDGTNSSRVFIIRRPDGTTLTIPPSNLTISGLTASAKYSAYAFWADGSACGLGFSPGDTGTPLIAFSASATPSTINQAKANQGLVGREPIGSFNWTQPGSGGSSGPLPPNDPPPIDPGTCVMLNTNIEPLGNIGPNEWRTNHFHHREWIRLETQSGRVLGCTPNHPLYSPEGRQAADSFKAGSWVITEQGEEKLSDVQKFLRDCTKVQVEMSRGHLFWANGFLSHNIKWNLT